MEPIEHNVVVRADAPNHFEEAEVATIEWQGRPMWSARQVTQALGYADDAEVVRKLTTDWSDELAEVTDYVVIRGDDLRALKAAAPGLVDPRAPALTLLTESGVHLVALLSRQPKARALRRWLAEQVLPSIRRTGGFNAPGALPAVDPAALSSSPLGAVVQLARLGWTPEQVVAVLHSAVPRARGTDPEDLPPFSPAPQRPSTLVGSLPWQQERAFEVRTLDFDNDPAAQDLRVLAELYKARLDAFGRPPFTDAPPEDGWMGRWSWFKNYYPEPYLFVRISTLGRIFPKRQVDVVIERWAERCWIFGGGFSGRSHGRIDINGPERPAVRVRASVLRQLGVVVPSGLDGER